MATKPLKPISEQSLTTRMARMLAPEDALARTIRDSIADYFGAIKPLSLDEYLKRIKAISELAEAGVIDSDTAAMVLREMTAKIVKLHLSAATSSCNFSTWVIT